MEETTQAGPEQITNVDRFPPVWNFELTIGGSESDKMVGEYLQIYDYLIEWQSLLFNNENYLRM